ncbi:MAG: 50S ribosomal protein L13 [Spirochaetota bacterium]|jgi:large subunit ribosomal protein L13|uniref:Large ribosomal subunit protein uL13 n=1 Tax=uncultured spirochete TaxID=156406 RepID=A0A3P3XLT4_9SPIR|nr:50S ribosomal protein L13 [Rectinema subterraneum]SLM15666.1 50S ribosomal subunit protein L13 [uncultured spirochete]HBE46620.1 50S ribosomal protein L13 [Spirochaetaceae bacterium]HCX96857.1 50S ribosomal protein L13 [Spirochaetaceae bacterium]
MKTVFVTAATAERKWYIIDAAGKPLGRVAVKVASILRGKNKPTFTPSQETGDYVIVINADKVAVTGRKRQNKMYYHHTGFPGGLKDYSFDELIDRNPVSPMEIAIRGMLPKGPLGRKLFKNVKVYAGPNHPHAAQMPIAIDL